MSYKRAVIGKSYYLWLLLSSAGNPIDIIHVIMQMFFTSNVCTFYVRETKMTLSLLKLVGFTRSC